MRTTGKCINNVAYGKNETSNHSVVAVRFVNPTMMLLRDKPMRDYERVQVHSRAEWRQWLQEHHGQSDSIWLVRFKKSSGQPTLTNDEIVEEALCFGWIDSVPAKLDEQRTMLLLSPRRPGSVWSRINRDRVPQLEELGLMAEPGRRAIQRAKDDGSWLALDGVDPDNLPVDLVAQLKRIKGAQAAFNGFSMSSRRAILEWIHSAKKPETRERRLKETARLAAIGLRANFPESRGK